MLQNISNRFQYQRETHMIKHLTDPNHLKYQQSDARISAKGIEQLSFAASNESINEKGLYFNARDSSIQYQSNSSLSELTKKTKQEMIVVELQKNEQLRINLYKAEKTISELNSIYKNLQSKLVNLLVTKKQQVSKKLKENDLALDQKVARNETKKKQGSGEDKCKNKYSYKELYDKHTQIVGIWKDCYSNLVEYITSYSKDISLLIQQYKTLHADHEHQKSVNKSKSKQENLNKILQQLNRKLEKSEVTIEKTLSELRGRDIKIQHYQMQNKALKTKILQCLEQIERMKRESKLKIRDNQSFKEVARSMQKQITQLSNSNKQLSQQLQIQLEKESLSNETQKSLNERIHSLELQISETKKFNDNLIEQYKKVSFKMQTSEEKLSEKYQFYEAMCNNKVHECEVMIFKTIKQKQSEQAKFEQKIKSLKTELERNLIAKSELEKQLANKSKDYDAIVMQLHNKEQEYQRAQQNIVARLQQKERQIHYLEELKEIASNKNQELKKEVDEVRSDLLVIIQELKVKDLEIEKYRQLCENKIQQIPSSQQIQQNRKDEIQYDSSSVNEQNRNFEQEPGIVWKKMRKSNDFNASQQNENFYYQCQEDENFDKKNIENKKNQNFTMMCSKTTPKLRVFGSELQTMNRNSSFEGKSRFNLQAFQNKLLIEGGAKFLFKLNQTMYC